MPVLCLYDQGRTGNRSNLPLHGIRVLITLSALYDANATLNGKVPCLPQQFSENGGFPEGNIYEGNWKD